LKGASPVTPAELVRPSFRNWFQDHYRYAYTAFRCARDL
jgi:gamma-glutamyl hercynylcysteine S-oxide synthase